MRARIHAVAILAASVLWMVAGLGMLAALLPSLQRPGLDDAILAVGCIALGLAASRFGTEFRSGAQRLSSTPDTAFHVLAAIALAPPVAALVGALAVLHAIRRAGSPLERVFLATSGALATGGASVVAHRVMDAAGPSASEVLVAATAAAATRAAVGLAGQLLVAESRALGGAATVARELPVRTILLLEAALPVLAVAAAGPFLDQPVVALAVVLAGQALVWRVMHIQHAHFRGGRVTDELLATFHRYVPRHVAERILATDGEHAEVGTGGELRDVSVMFIDIRGFTSWSERTPPSEVLAELNRLLGDLADSIIVGDGTIDKFTGDGLMALWNAPADQPDHALRAVQALPRLLMRLREFNLRREAQRQSPLEIGIGVATGPAMVGTIGHRDRLAYTAIGDTVNLAARLEQSTRQHQVAALVDERTFLALPTGVQRQLMRLDSITVKGRAQRVCVYAPIALVQHRPRESA